MPYLTIIEPQKTPIVSAVRRSRCVFVSVPFRCPVNWRRAARGGVGQMAEAIERGAGATRVQRHFLGSDLGIRPANSRFEENGATSKTHCVAMTYGLFRASDIVY